MYLIHIYTTQLVFASGSRPAQSFGIKGMSLNIPDNTCAKFNSDRLNNYGVKE